MEIFSFLTLVLPYDFGARSEKALVLKSLLKDNSKAALNQNKHLIIGFLFRCHPPERQQNYTDPSHYFNIIFENTVFRRKSGSLPSFKIQSRTPNNLSQCSSSKSRKQRQGDKKSIIGKLQATGGTKYNFLHTKIIKKDDKFNKLYVLYVAYKV